jgi:hypothetical protein
MSQQILSIIKFVFIIKLICILIVNIHAQEIQDQAKEVILLENESSVDVLDKSNGRYLKTISINYDRNKNRKIMLNKSNQEPELIIDELNTPYINISNLLKGNESHSGQMEFSIWECDIPNCYGCCGGGFEPGDLCIYSDICLAHDLLCKLCDSPWCGPNCEPDNS